jgi:hypothetical protein
MRIVTMVLGLVLASVASAWSAETTPRASSVMVPALPYSPAIRSTLIELARLHPGTPQMTLFKLANDSTRQFCMNQCQNTYSYCAGLCISRDDKDQCVGDCRFKYGACANGCN